jgi:hypothetical protein
MARTGTVKEIDKNMTENYRNRTGTRRELDRNNTG